MKKLCLLIFCVLMVYSCSHIKSGQYVKLVQDNDLLKLSDAYDVPVWIIESANPGKKFVKGEWVFVPTTTGLMGGYDQWGLAESPTYHIKKGEFIWPVPAGRRVSSPFGKRWGNQHEGIDIPAKKGSHILASQDGVVVYAGAELGGYGNITVISHKNGFFTVYAHAKKLFVKKGSKVHQGSVIAQVGSTGRSTGAHLHFEIRHNSKALNPLSYVETP